MSHQQCFEFDPEDGGTQNVGRASEVEINETLRRMQSLPTSDPNKDILANEILEWLLTR
jgi:hypothetical protein